MSDQIKFETKERIVHLYKMDVLTNLEIAGACHVSLVQLFDVLEDMKAGRKYTDKDQTKEVAIRKLYLEAESIETISERVGVGRRTIYKVITEANLHKRNLKE